MFPDVYSLRAPRNNTPRESCTNSQWRRRVSLLDAPIPALVRAEWFLIDDSNFLEAFAREEELGDQQGDFGEDAEISKGDERREEEQNLQERERFQFLTRPGLSAHYFGVQIERARSRSRKGSRTLDGKWRTLTTARCRGGNQRDETRRGQVSEGYG